MSAGLWPGQREAARDDTAAYHGPALGLPLMQTLRQPLPPGCAVRFFAAAGRSLGLTLGQRAVFLRSAL